MRLKRFSVKGYKNLTQEVVLEDMGPVCVIHGENNTGKSNILEAVNMYFSLVRYIYNEKLSNTSGEEYIKYSYPDPNHLFDKQSNILFAIEIAELDKFGVDLSYSFNLIRPDQIKFSGCFYERKVHENNILAALAGSDIEISLTLEQDGEKVNAILSAIKNVEKSPVTQSDIKWILDYLFKPNQETRRTTDLILIGIDRLISGSELGTTREIIPQQLLLTLYDFKDSTDPKLYKTWDLFNSIISKFKKIIGNGDFVSIYNRATQKANLVYDTGDVRIPIYLLGSGIQQLVALLARLSTTDTSIVCIEEPELNLRFSVQEQLREVFQEITNNPLGPEQIIISSHSPAFEAGTHFYGMESTATGIALKRRPVSEARRYTHHVPDSPSSESDAPISYVTTEGLVRLPENVRALLNLEHGGGITFLHRKDTGHVELLTDEQYLNLFETHEYE